MAKRITNAVELNPAMRGTIFDKEIDVLIPNEQVVVAMEMAQQARPDYTVAELGSMVWNYIWDNFGEEAGLIATRMLFGWQSVEDMRAAYEANRGSVCELPNLRLSIEAEP